MDDEEWLPAYEGNDMIGYMLQRGWKFPSDRGAIRSMTNVRDTAVIVTEHGVWRAKPCSQVGFCIEVAAYF
jgi:hypothetical protein